MNCLTAARPHWVVRMNHRNRAGSFVFVFAILGVHFWERGLGPMPWVLAAAQFLVYPHLLCLRARTKKDQLEAEIQNLLLDNVCFGAWVVALGAPLWISYTLVACGCVNMAAFRASKGVLQAVLAACAGGLACAVVSAPTRFQPDTSLVVTLMCMVCLSAYLIVFARSAHSRTVMLSDTRLKLRQSEAALQQQLEDIQSLQAQLTEQANRDPLTGLYNRRYLADSLGREFDRCARDGVALSIVIIDLDHFKLINDQHGHSAGDEVLRQVSLLLLQSMRSSDICCRYGGEEFLLVLPGVELDAALQRAEQCRQRIAEQRWHANGRGFGVTLSVGLACSQDARMPPDHLIALADQALYRAKAEGRNRVCLSFA
ncbi:MAG: diguanylate cyclase [Burkholderiales bacterium]|nr:diguanylate cyclase [Burkholderiales bacterium]MBH2016991.1 diguanylate cyclase [Burkholderiales bacterium]